MNPLTRFQTSVLLATFLAAWDSTVVGTIGPTIARHLPGIALYPWMLTGFMIATTVVAPIFGRLADRFEPGFLYRLAIGLFVMGSLGSAAAQNMTLFVAARVLQGTGAGGIFTLGLILMGRQFVGLDRVRMQGRLSAMWGLAGVLGPTLGGLVAQWSSWRLLFLINIPLGIVAAAFVSAEYIKSEDTTSYSPIDGWGAVLLAVWITLGLAALTVFRQNFGMVWGWILLGLAVLAIIVWLKTESRTVEPLIPLHWLRSFSIVGPIASALIASGSLYGAALIIPLWVQIAFHYAPFATGLILLPLPVGWALGSMLAKPLLTRFSFRTVQRYGVIGILAGFLFFQSTAQESAWTWMIAVGDGILGGGVGLVIMTTLVTVQSIVSPTQIGAATGLYNLARNLGNALGPGIMGGLILIFWRQTPVSVAHAIGRLDSFSLSAAIHTVFWGVVVIAAALLVLVQRMPHPQAKIFTEHSQMSSES